MTNTATTLTTTISTVNDHGQECMCDDCLQFSTRLTLIPDETASARYKRITETIPDIRDQIDPLWDLLTDATAILSPATEKEIAEDIVSIEGILRQAEEQRSHSAVDNVLQGMPTMANELRITEDDLIDDSDPMGCFKGYGECDDTDTPDSKNEPHPEGCTCDECADHFFARVGIDDDIDPFSEDEHYHMFIWGAAEDDTELLEDLKALLSDMEARNSDQQWLMKKIKREIKMLTERLRLEERRKNITSRVQTREDRAEAHQEEDEERRTKGRLKRRAQKGRNEWSSKPRKMERRRTRRQYAQEAA